MRCTSRLSTRTINIVNIYKWITNCYQLLRHASLCWLYKFALLKQALQRHNKKIDFNLKNIVHWLRANKVSLNTSKTETILIRTTTAKKTEMKKYMNSRISEQKINVFKEAKYLGLKLDQHLTFKQHVHTIKLKLNIANGLLRYHVDSKPLKTIY